MDETDARERLIRRRAELDEEDRISAADRAPVKLDQDSVGRLSRMDAMQVQAMALAAQRRRVAERARIAAALQRLDEKEWGYCLGCGDPIAPGRLEHDPSVSRCVRCASGGSH
jgi:DnaK suppressor protein